MDFIRKINNENNHIKLNYEYVKYYIFSTRRYLNKSYI